MRKIPPGLLALLLVLSHASPCAAQGGARAPKDEEPLAAALRLARGLETDRELALARLVHTHQAVGQLEEAAAAAGVMDDGGMKALMLSRIADAFAEAGKFERAAELLSESLRTVLRAEDDQGLTPEVLLDIVGCGLRFNLEEFPHRRETYKGALARFLEAGRAGEAAGILSQVRRLALDPDRDPFVAARVLSGAARLYAASDAPKAAEFLSEALAAARRVEEADERVRALCEVARAHAYAGDGKAAKALLDEAHQSASALGAEGEGELSEVAAAYAAAGLTDEALKVVPEADVDEWDASAVAVRAAAAAGRPEALKESLTRALSKAMSLEGENSRSRALSDLAVIYGARSPDLLADVLWSARTLEDGEERANALAAVGDRYAEAGRKESALEAWSQAYEAARAVKLDKRGFEPRSSTRGDADKLRLLRALALRLMRAGQYGRAPEIARDMRAVQSRALALTRGGPVSVREADASLAGLADELTRAGQKEAALAVLAEAGDAHERPGENTNPYMRAEALAAVGAAYAKAGDKARAAVYLRRALQLAEGLEDYGDQKLSALVFVGARYAEAGMRPDAGARKSLRRLVRGVEEERE